MSTVKILLGVDIRTRFSDLAKDQKLTNGYVEQPNKQKQLVTSRPGVTFYLQMPIV